MSDETRLRYVRPEDVEFDSIPMEKRSDPRWRMRGRATAVCCEQMAGDQRNRIGSVELINMSNGGVGVLCQDDMPVGSEVTIFIPAHGPDGGYDLTGRVVRSIPRGQQHEIGIQIYRRLAAA